MKFIRFSSQKLYLMTKVDKAKGLWSVSVIVCPAIITCTSSETYLLPFEEWLPHPFCTCVCMVLTILVSHSLGQGTWGKSWSHDHKGQSGLFLGVFPICEGKVLFFYGESVSGDIFHIRKERAFSRREETKIESGGERLLLLILGTTSSFLPSWRYVGLPGHFTLCLNIFWLIFCHFSSTQEMGQIHPSPPDNYEVHLHS